MNYYLSCFITLLIIHICTLSMSDYKDNQSSYIHNNKCLVSLLKKCNKYINDNRYVYKVCCDFASENDKSQIKC